MADLEKEYFKNKEEFNKYLALLNAFSDPLEQWKPIRARSEDLDEFWFEIQEGETYYARLNSLDYETVKLGETAMEHLLFMLFVGNPKMSAVAAELVARQNDSFSRQREEVSTENGRAEKLQHESTEALNRNPQQH